MGTLHSGPLKVLLQDPCPGPVGLPEILTVAHM